MKSGSLNRTSTIPEEEERPSADSSLEGMASWARGLGKNSTKITLSTKHKKRMSDIRGFSMPKESTLSMHATALEEISSRLIAEQEKSQLLKSTSLDKFSPEPSSLSTARRATNEASWNPDATTQPRARRLFLTSSDPSYPTTSNRDGPSSSLASRFQTSSTSLSPPHVTANSEGRSTSFASVTRTFDGDRRRHDRTTSDPSFAYFRPDDITRNSEPNENTPFDLNAEQSFVPLSPRSLEELSKKSR